MYAFLSNHSACEALRFLADKATEKPLWPQEPRKLPRWGDCVCTQRGFACFAKEADLASYGITTEPVDLLVPDASGYSRGKRARFHVWKNPLPARAFLRLDENLLTSSPAFILLQMAAHNFKSDAVIEDFHKDLEAARAVQALVDQEGRAPFDDPFEWSRHERLVRMALVACEFAGTYRLAVADKETAYGLAPLMSRESARAFARSIPRLYGANRFHATLDLAFDGSASPMETALALLLTLPLEFGGYGLPRPSLNEALPTGEFAALWNGGDRITPDLLWKEVRLVIEYESDEFHGLLGLQKATDDATRANVLSAMGYTVLRATTASVTSQVELDRLARQVATFLGTALVEPDEATRIRRHKLHSLLMHP